MIIMKDFFNIIYKLIFIAFTLFVFSCYFLQNVPFYVNQLTVVRESEDKLSPAVYVLKPSQPFYIKDYEKNNIYIDVNGCDGYIAAPVSLEKTNYEYSFNHVIYEPYLYNLNNALFSSISQPGTLKYVLPDLSEDERQAFEDFLNENYFSFVDYKVSICQIDEFYYIDVKEFIKEFTNSITINNEYQRYLQFVYDYQTDLEKIITIFNNIKNYNPSNPEEVFQMCLIKLNIPYSKEDSLFEINFYDKTYQVSFKENLLLIEKTLGE